MRGYGRMLRYAARQSPALALVLGLAAANSAATALQPWPMKLLVDYALGQAAVPAFLTSALDRFSLSPSATGLIVLAGLGSLGLLVLNSALGVVSQYAWALAGQRMIGDLGADLFRQLLRRSPQIHGGRNVGDLLNRLMYDSWCVQTVADSLLISPWRHLLTLVGVAVVAWSLDAELTAFSLLAVGPAMGVARFFALRLRRQALRQRQAESGVMSFVQQTLGALSVVQAFGSEARNERHFGRLAAEAVTRSQRLMSTRGAYGLASRLFTAGGTAVVLYVGGLRVLSGALSIGSLLVFVAYLRSVTSACSALLEAFISLKIAEARIERVLEVLEADEGVRDAPGARPLPAGRPSGRGRVRLEGVTFGYEPGRPVLHAVSLEAGPGETLALVGPSGAGKSTLVALVPRFFDPWEGRVTFDGQDLRELRLASLRAQVALVPQETVLLPLSVADNIAYGRPGAGRAEVEAAARAAGADEFIRGLPRGYDTPLGERGASLSGGERQRLAIARALLKDAPVLILDEPTSAVDARTEALLLEALERLMGGRTTFVIAHRLSTIRRADRIVVLEAGRVAEAGAHRELLAADGPYRRLHDAQFGPAASVVA